MPRYALALIAVFTLAAPHALGQAIQFEGSVQPVAPVGFPVVGGSDSNGDGVIDFLSTGGNGIITTGISQTDPEGLSGNGLAWDAIRIYRNYETAQNILVGDAQQSGRLAISAGGTLRYQHLVIGGVSSRLDPTNGLDIGLMPAAFQNADVDAQAGISGGGTGVVTVSGFGSLFSNDPNVIDPNVQTALILAEGNDPNTALPIVDLFAELDVSNNPFAAEFLPREVGGNENDSSYDVIVGLNGSGALNVEDGGRVEIRDALMAGVGSQANGTVSVSGIGSTLVAFGRFDLMVAGMTLDPQRSLSSTSFVGGRGTGILTVSEGGRAEFFNGLSIGAPIGVVQSDDEGSGSGTVVVTGAGSFLNAASSSATDMNDLALAVGEIRDSLADPFDPSDPDDANLQSGVLEINAGGVVTTSAGFGDTLADADAAIGKRGEVNLAGGQLQVGDNLDNDGVVSGYGTVRARTMDTSLFSVIRGGNPNSENPELAEPLRLVLLNPSDTANDPAFFNRGLVEGRVNFEVSGAIVNDGQIETSGEIFAESLYTTTESRVRQFVGSESPLRLRLNSTAEGNDAAGSINPGDPVNFGALHNRGSIEGDLDFIVNGGVVNGDNNLPIDMPPATGSAGGSIIGSGRILAATFLNNAEAEVRVREGESLSILTNSDATTGLAATFELGDGIPTTDIASTDNYRTMNLGSMSVDGGSLEIGYQPPDSSQLRFTFGGVLNTGEIFYNARYIVEAGGVPIERTVGTITVNDGELRLPTGMINAGVLAFTGGDNLVNGTIFNVGIDYDNGGGSRLELGAIVVSGEGTTVTFEDLVVNDGAISIGPFDNVVNFLGGLTQTAQGLLNFTIATDAASGAQESAAIVVDGTATISGGGIIASLLAPPASLSTDFSIALLVADELSEDSLFTELVLPELGEGQFWDIVYDTENDEVRLEIVESDAFGADFNGDGIVSQDDVDVWIRNAGITMGASTIQGDADLDGDVDLADYDVLMAQLFTGIPELVNNGIALAQGAVPEPGTALLLCLAAVSAGATRRR